MVRIDAVFDSACAQVDVEADDKASALKRAVDILGMSGRVPDKGKLLEEIEQRESMTSTAIGNGVALPHALSDSVPDTVLGLVRLARPVSFGAPDGAPVDLLLVMAGPRNKTTDHLQLLSKLARILHDADFRAALRRAADGPELASLLRAKE